jgi:unsaturated chondroitin disaccharide hydrolase
MAHCYDESIARLLGRIRLTSDSGLDGFPHHGDVTTGAWTTSPDGFWTGGYWVGALWLASVATGEAELKASAQDWLQRLESRIDSQTVFRGFLFLYAGALGADLAEDSRATDFAIRAARSLAATFDERAGLMPLGRDAEEAHTVGPSETNIDGLTASPLLLWAAARTGDAELRRIALSHAHRNAHYCVRDDGGVIQSATFDAGTGALVRRFTHKGSTDDSVWTRAQSWAMLGFTLSATLAPEDVALLAHAEQVSDWWLDHVPADLVAYWDFDVEQGGASRRDTSGTAIAAAALLKLCRIHPDREKAARYRDGAERTIEALVRRHLTPTDPADPRPHGILADGCFDHRAGVAMSNELIWGDYYLLESLLVLRGGLPALTQSKLVSA